MGQLPKTLHLRKSQSKVTDDKLEPRINKS